MSHHTFPRNKEIILKSIGTWPETAHLFEERPADALEAALAARRPLLVRGEPGTGKSQLARAAAQHLGRPFISEVIHGNSERQDLLYRFDAVARLGEAQIRRSECGNALAPEFFLAPGPLWWTINWQTAEKQYKKCTRGARGTVPVQPKGWKQENGCVLLIDEIDKADSDLPNSLLETLGNAGFPVPYGIGAVKQSRDAETPLVIITSNGERELPPAFVRRCLVLRMELPGGDALEEWLIRRGRVHFGRDAKIRDKRPPCSEEVMKEAAAQLRKDREDALEQGFTPPGQAEYLDILRAVRELADDEQGQLAKLALIKDFSLKKFTGSIHG